MTMYRRTRLAIATALCLGLWADLAAAQDTTTATLLKVLGEAVDGYRTGQPVYVVAAFRSPYPVYGVFSTRDSASSALPRAGRGYSVFGPYVAPLDGPGEVRYALSACPHYWPTVYKCPTRSFAVGASRVDSVRVTVFVRSGPPQSTTYPRAEVDALFFTLSAIDKFVIPYYQRLLGAASADSLRKGFVQGFYAGGRSGYER